MLGVRIGLVMGMDDRGTGPAPRWDDLLTHARAAERVGFDLLTVPDALSDGPVNFWEGMTMAGAIAAATDSIGVTHSTINAPMRPPALVARAAQTLDEISGGRYTLGLGAGNTPEDYRSFGIAAEPRFSRFVDTLTVVRSLLRDGSAHFTGEFERAVTDRFEPSGPRPGAIPINVAAGGPKMAALTVRLADEWNWWAGSSQVGNQLADVLDHIARECELQERDPAALVMTVDIYSFDPLGTVDDPPPHVHSGPLDAMAESLLALNELGIDEVRIDLAVTPLDRRVGAIEAMQSVVEALHGL